MLNNSYAYFEESVEGSCVALQVGNIAYESESKIMLYAGQQTKFDLVIKSSDNVASKYQVYYTSDDELDGIEVGYYSNSIDLPSGGIDPNEEKTITIYLSNNSDSIKTISIGVKGGLEQNSVEDIILESNEYRVTEEITYKPPVVTVSVNGLSATFSMTDDTGIIGYGVSESSQVEPEYIEVEKATIIEKTWQTTKPGTYYVWVKDDTGNVSTTSFAVRVNLITYDASNFTLTNTTEFTTGTKLYALRRYSGKATIDSPLIDISNSTNLKIVGTFSGYSGYSISRYLYIYSYIYLVDSTGATVATLYSSSALTCTTCVASGTTSGLTNEEVINIDYDLSEYVGEYKLRFVIDTTDISGSNWYGILNLTWCEFL